MTAATKLSDLPEFPDTAPPAGMHEGHWRGRTLKVTLPEVESQISIQVELIGPEQAQRILDRNNGNRNLRAANVRNLVRAMTNGVWKFNGEPIRIDANGNLQDGQHRLHAIKESGVSLPLVVIRGLPTEAFATIDVGLKRQFADGLRSVDSLPANRVVIGAMANGILSAQGSPNATVPEVTRFVEQHRDRLVRAYETSHRAGLELGSQKLFGIAAYYILEANLWAGTEFFDSIATGANLNKNDPRLALMRRLRNDRVRGGLTKRLNHGPEVRSAVNMVIRTYNAWRDGKTYATVQYVGGAKKILAPVRY